MFPTGKRFVEHEGPPEARGPSSVFGVLAGGRKRFDGNDD